MTCFLCSNKDASESENFMAGTYRYQCPNCGKYEISDSLVEDFCDEAYITQRKDNNVKGYRGDEVKFKAACLAAEKNLKGLDNYFLHQEERQFNKENGIHIIDFIKDFPDTPLEQFNRALLNLGRVTKNNPFQAIQIDESKSNILFLRDKTQLATIIHFFEGNQFIKIQTDLSDVSESCYLIVITPYGWERISELQKYYKENSSKAFLAMWFDKTTENFRKAVQKGAELAGYQLLVVDEEHHNDFIMNKVLNMIDEAKFVITDFTCVPEDDCKPEENIKVKGGIRGGVYFEAGYAKGQGKEVIMTCNDSLAACKRRHFDVDQINTIFWKERAGEIITSQGEVPMYEYMRERIIQSVGKGPLDK